LFAAEDFPAERGERICCFGGRRVGKHCGSGGRVAIGATTGITSRSTCTSPIALMGRQFWFSRLFGVASSASNKMRSICRACSNGQDSSYLRAICPTVHVTGEIEDFLIASVEDSGESSALASRGALLAYEGASKPCGRGLKDRGGWQADPAKRSLGVQTWPCDPVALRAGSQADDRAGRDLRKPLECRLGLSSAVLPLRSRGAACCALCKDWPAPVTFGEGAAIFLRGRSIFFGEAQQSFWRGGSQFFARGSNLFGEAQQAAPLHSNNKKPSENEIENGKSDHAIRLGIAQRRCGIVVLGEDGRRNRLEFNEFLRRTPAMPSALRICVVSGVFHGRLSSTAGRRPAPLGWCALARWRPKRCRPRPRTEFRQRARQPLLCCPVERSPAIRRVQDAVSRGRIASRHDSLEELLAPPPCPHYGTAATIHAFPKNRR